MLKWFQQSLEGPMDEGFEELLPQPPLEYYCTGILAPASSQPPLQSLESQAPESSAETEGAPLPGKEDSDDVSSVSDNLPNAAIGLSFLATHDVSVEVIVSAARYEKVPPAARAQGDQSSSRWRRIAIPEESLSFSPPPSPGTSSRNTRGFCGEVTARWRRHGEKNWLITVALINRSPMDGGSHYREELSKACLFQTKFSCALSGSGRILPYPRAEGIALTEEEDELEFQYRDRKIYAIGHSVAADWDLKDGEVSVIRAAFLPCVDVPTVTTANSELPLKAMEQDFLAGITEHPKEVFGELSRFVDCYEGWVEEQAAACSGMKGDDAAIASRISGRQRRALRRMRDGLAFIGRDEKARQAFALAQEAMRLQMLHVRLLQGNRSTLKTVPRWRPFQLAFMLMALESVLDPECGEDRKLVDLLWFPTGGGKTEAYLALIAVLAIYRRLRWPAAGSGTSVIMRYTLRLLTAQQFQRATALICALELTRRRKPEKLGYEPITGGLWVGSASTPNTNREALELLDQIRRGERTEKGLFLDQCPWCGTLIAPPPGDGNLKLGIRAVGDGIEFFCPNPECEFRDRLPLHVVDEHLYENPPTLLMATIDKFARITWEPRASAFLGQRGNRPPELIIQDELHLISGPLGSFAGIYEAAIDSVLKYKGISPKYIASTATTRHARQQVRMLYGREMAVFPPSGHSIDDSFFARTDRTRPGRSYVGLSGCNPFLNWRETLGAASAAFLASPSALRFQDEALIDAWWTLVIYHGSLGGVGQSHRLARSDIPRRLRLLLEMHGDLTENKVCGEPAQDGQGMPRALHRDGQIMELTSRVDAAGIQEVLRRLQLEAGNPDSVSLVLCTNMLSVGIDISRLALMIVNGQPLATAEYIQASSRVGRADVPGIILVNYNRRPRDLSHFENFRPYHESFYRFVEPASVTPFSAPARHLALHAALVILMRHAVGLLDNSDAFKMDPEDGKVKKAVKLLVERCLQADPESEPDVREQIGRILKEWVRHKGNNLVYLRQPGEPQFPSLLRNIFEPPEKGLWETMQSMRSVDRVSEIELGWPYNFAKK